MRAGRAEPPSRAQNESDGALREVAPAKAQIQGSHGEPFLWRVRVYWEDTDAGGIVFYANYLKFFERARTEWLRSLGVAQSHLREATGGMFVVSDTTVRYLRPARLDDELLVTAELRERGRASLIIAQQALDAASGTVLCQGTIRIGWVGAADLQPARIPPAILDALTTRNR